MKRKMKNNGFFITFESTGEGLGKTTQTKILKENLEKMGYEVILTREPGGTDFGNYIRDFVLFRKGMKIYDRAELFSFMTDRAQHYEELLKPSLEAGKIVISDRYFDSTLAYQGAKGWSEKKLWTLHEIATDGLLPNLTFVLDGISMKELDTNDHFESMCMDETFRKKVRQKTLEQINKSDRYYLLNKQEDIEQTSKKILDVTLKCLSKVINT